MQPKPEGRAQACLAEAFLAGAPSAMSPGDNLYFGHGLPEQMARADAKARGGTVFGYRVADPGRYGAVDSDHEQTSSPDAIAWHMSWIDDAALAARAERFGNTAHGRYLGEIACGPRPERP